jgi:CRISPR-associated endonuclease Csn1
MEQGKPFKTAEKIAYPDRKSEHRLDFLPPISDSRALPELRNPVVTRVLTETRKVINAVIREYGKPALIRVELARDLKKSKSQREAISRINWDNRKEREKAAAWFRESFKREPKPNDLLKYVLWEECNRVCPYTGKSISEIDLFGPHPTFDVEHIIPFSRSLDNSFLNKTLCHVEENRQVKHNKTPYEAYAHSDKWNAILDCVGRFKTSVARARTRKGKTATGNPKLAKFQMTTEEVKEQYEDFDERHLNDTRYASRLATKYLKLLYGEEADKRKIVQVGRGEITKYLRDVWDFNKILNDGSVEKKRDDHRHHAVDAVAIALTSPKTVKLLSDSAARAYLHNRRNFAPVPAPWPSLYDQVDSQIKQLIVSHRVSRKVSGPLHEETFYGKRACCEEGKVRIRKQVKNLKSKEVDCIADPIVQARVKLRLTELGETDPTKAFQDEKNLPFMQAKDGRVIPIRKVRLNLSRNTFQVGTGPRTRHVENKENHHIEIVEVEDKKGNKKWEGYIVSMMEAKQRLAHGAPVVKRDHGEGKRFVFSLSGGESIELTNKDTGNREMFRIRTITSQGRHAQVFYVRLNDARLKADILKTGGFFSGLMEPLHKLDCRKVIVTPFGKVRRAND